jgi:hypothetical protein
MRLRKSRCQLCSIRNILLNSVNAVRACRQARLYTRELCHQAFYVNALQSTSSDFQEWCCGGMRALYGLW